MMRMPNAKLEMLVDAASEPIELSDAANFLRLEIPDDNALVQGLITSARMECEQRTNRSFINTTWQLSLDYFPPYPIKTTNILPALAFGVAAVGGRTLFLNMESGAIRLPMPPLISVSSISYVDPSGQTNTLPFQNIVISTGTPGQIAPSFGNIFPLTIPSLSSVTIEYVAGYGPDASYVPQTVKLAILFLVDHYYNHRTSDEPEPKVIENLLRTVDWCPY